MMIDLLVTMLIIVILMFGVDYWTPARLMMAIAFIGVIVVIVHFFSRWLIAKVMGSLWKMGEYRTPSRRKIHRGHARRTRKEAGLEGLEEAELRDYIEHHPDDALACEILCERLKTEGRLAEYAREMQYLLTLSADLSTEEQCSRYHELADLYLNKLNRPDRAAEMLHALIAKYPKHYQASLARRRLDVLRDGATPTGADVDME